MLARSSVGVDVALASPSMRPLCPCVAVVVVVVIG
jgi:hypothetical protein